MNTNIQGIADQIRQQMESILATVLDSTGEAPQAYQMERALLASLLDLAKSLFLIYILAQDRKLLGVKSAEFRGKTLPLQDHYRRTLGTIFGLIEFERGYYYTAGAGKGHFLLDALLNLPTKRSSDLLREWPRSLSCHDAYHKSGEVIGEIIAYKLAELAFESVAVALDVDHHAVVNQTVQYRRCAERESDCFRA